jgi:hypothetical protein
MLMVVIQLISQHRSTSVCLVKNDAVVPTEKHAVLTVCVGEMGLPAVVVVTETTVVLSTRVVLVPKPALILRG